MKMVTASTNPLRLCTMRSKGGRPLCSVSSPSPAGAELILSAGDRSVDLLPLVEASGWYK